MYIKFKELKALLHEDRAFVSSFMQLVIKSYMVIDAYAKVDDLYNGMATERRVVLTAQADGAMGWITRELMRLNKEHGAQAGFLYYIPIKKTMSTTAMPYDVRASLLDDIQQAVLENLDVLQL